MYQKYNIACTEIDTLKEDTLQNVKINLLFNRVSCGEIEKEKEMRKTILLLEMCL